MKVDAVVALAARIFGVGKRRIRVNDVKEAEAAMTREDVRKLVERGVLEILPKKGVSRHRARYRHLQKRKGRRRGPGSRKGRKTARRGKKRRWIRRIRAIRRLLKELKAKGKIDQKEYRRIYTLSKGGFVRSRSHVYEILKEMRR